MRRAQALGARVSLATPSEVADLVPAIRVDDVALASWEAESGYADRSRRDLVGSLEERDESRRPPVGGGFQQAASQVKPKK